MCGSVSQVSCYAGKAVEVILEVGSHLDATLGGLLECHLQGAEEALCPWDSLSYKAEFPQGFLVSLAGNTPCFT